MSITAPAYGEPGSLRTTEIFWRDHQRWLQDVGYLLRPRYRPDWTPSWGADYKNFDTFEDGQSLRFGHIMDATHISTGSQVSLKKINMSVHPHEVKIGQFLSTSAIASDTHNRCVPILEVLQVPDDDDLVLIVMPLLRVYNSPRFDTFGEVVQFFDQAFEGLQFLHKLHIAHRDCTGRNIMMDPTPLYPEGYHPTVTDLKRDYSGTAPHYTRTQRPTNYLLVDFGLSRRYNPKDGPPLEDQILGIDKTVPEFQTSDEPCDPFPTDVYYIGNLVRQDFIRKKFGFEFMEPLVSDMVQEDPSKRPTMDEVVQRFDLLKKSLSSWKLRSRVVGRKDNAFLGVYRSITHWGRRVSYIIRRVPAIPVPPPFIRPDTR